MELINLFIDPNIQDKSGVSAIALVDSPAIEEGWVAFNKQNPNLKHYKIEFANEKDQLKPVEGDKQICAGPLMIPNKKIYRRDGEKEYEVIFTPETIRLIQEKFSLQNRNTAINEMHQTTAVVNGGLVSHFIIDRKKGYMPPYGMDHLEDGTWFGEIKINDKDKWDTFIKTGIYTGFSVEGFFYEAQVMSDSDLKELDEILSLL
jgi:hypothetical protein